MRFSILILVAWAAGQMGSVPLSSQARAAKADWNTETFARIAGRQLTDFAKSAATQNAGPAIAAKFFQTHVESSVPADAPTGSVIPPFDVYTDTAKRVSIKEPAKLIAVFQSEWQNITDAQFHFKVITVTPRRSSVETKVLVSVRGLIKDAGTNAVAAPWEQHSEWTVVWTPSKSGTPLITELHVDHEQTAVARRQNNSKTTKLFIDRTDGVLGGQASYHEQLAFGQPYWLRRIESFHGMLNPGQNGISLGDLNGDDLDDVYVCQPGGMPNRVYLQEEDGSLTDASEATRLNLLDNTHSALIIDLDNDGDQDVALATGSAFLVYENNNARFTLQYVNRDMSDAYSMVASDFDRDGDLDLYACGYFPNGANVNALPIPIPYFDAKNGGANRLFRNEGRWNFADVTDSIGLNTNNRRFSYAAIWVDFNNDGNDDIYVANDFGPDNAYQSERVNGTIRFVDASQRVGLQHGAFGMSAAATDINRDGFDDIYVANMFSSAGNRVTRQPQFQVGADAKHRSIFQRLANGNSFLLNEAGRRFTDVGISSGTSMGRWSWGSNFVDMNNDGWDDLLVTNGYITGESAEDS